MAEMASGTVTFLFSDVERSTELLERHGAAMGGALARHHELFEQIVERHGGAIFETVGDAVYAAFSNAGAAVAAALDAQRGLAAEDWGPILRLAVRIALHTGAVERRGDHYFGPALFRVARLQALGYGEQTLLSGVTAQLVAEALPEAASLRDLGSHRLKDLGEPERVYQLVHPELRAEFPPLKSLDAHPHNLPPQLSSFVGRDAELIDLGKLLKAHRLVTLLGPGGIGKTRLALQAAADALDSCSEGVFFVDLAPVDDPELVPGTVAATLGLREQPGQPIRATIADYLAPKHLLLVLDNLEQLLPAAASSVAEFLAAAPELRMLATSRAPLRIRGEHEYWVAPLAIGAPDRLSDEVPPAVALFLERARAIQPDLEVTATTGPLIAAICERLDGLPLAIELGAARLRLFGLTQLNDRLTHRLPILIGGARDWPERQQTLRAAIAWSDELLNESERRLFGRLGVFVGGFTLQAVEVVAGTDLGGNVFEAMSALLEQSLVRQAAGPADEPRYQMLETIREYALERGDELGDREAASHRHAGYFLEVAERESPMLRRAGGERVRERLNADYPNFRAALEYAIQGAEEQLALRLVAGLWRLWDANGRWREGLALAEQALALPGAPLSAARAEAVHVAGILCGLLGMRDDGRSYTEQSLVLHRQLGDLRGVSRALNNLADPTHDPAAAIAMYKESLALARDVGDYWDTASTHINLAMSELFRDDLQAAEYWATQGLDIARAAGDAPRMGTILLVLGSLRQWRGEADEARSLYADAQQELGGDPGMTASALSLSASAEMHVGDQRRARQLLSEALRFLRAGDWQETASDRLLDAAAHIAVRDDPLLSATLWGAADGLRARVQQPRFPAEGRYFAERLAAGRSRVTDEEFEGCYQSGLRLSTAEALAMVETFAQAEGA